MIFSLSDVVRLVKGSLFRISDNDWFASHYNVLLSTGRDSLLLDQDGLLDHARLRLLDDPHLYLLLRHGGVHLLTRLHGLHGLLGLLRLGSFLSFLFVVLDLLLLSVDDNLSNHDIEGHSDSDLDSENDVKNGLVCITRSARKIVTVIDIFQENDKDDEQKEADDQ